MPTPDSQLSTLQKIRNKVRKITRSPSIAQLTDDDIDEQVNVFMLYDFPEELRLKTLLVPFTFYTEPYIDIYGTDADVADPTSPFYNFRNNIISVHNPAYVAGQNVFYTQSLEQFNGLYPKINALQVVATGDGVTNHFAGVLNGKPLLHSNVTFGSIDATNFGITLIDTPGTTNNTLGYMEAPGTVINFALPPVPTRKINYITGAYDVTFPVAPAAGKNIVAAYVPVVCARPQGMMFWSQKFTLRPVPDAVYRVDTQVFIRPVALMTNNTLPGNPASLPEYSDWFQYVAYGASKKIFEDRMDMESVQSIMPELKRQERLVLRRTNAQQANERSATIFTGMSGTGYGGFGTGSSGWGPW